MTLWTDLFQERHLVERIFYEQPGTVSKIVPARASIMRLSGVGAGGRGNTAYGGGAAFARRKTSCTPGEELSLQVGNNANTVGTGSAAGDTIVTRVTGNVVLLKAVRGQGLGAGSSADCVGDIKRSGLWAASSVVGFASGGDDEDVISLGFGGRGAIFYMGAGPGGSGVDNIQQYKNFEATYIINAQYFAGYGRLCVEFFDADPGY